MMMMMMVVVVTDQEGDGRGGDAGEDVETKG
jgi:histidinol phosphatase-like enzyme